MQKLAMADKEFAGLHQKEKPSLLYKQGKLSINVNFSQCKTMRNKVTSELHKIKQRLLNLQRNSGIIIPSLYNENGIKAHTSAQITVMLNSEMF